MKYPLGVQSFESIRHDGYLYIDKTALIYQIANGGKYYFLSRPRRFGKSLLISTLEAYFLGKKELFKGLKMEQLEQEWKVFPVLHLDLNARNYSDKEALLAELNKHLEIWEAEYGSEYKDRAPEERFQHVIVNAYKKTGEKVVILVDEYDKPLLQVLEDKPLLDEYRRILKAFYGVEKTMDAYIQFGLFSGVTKFSKVSVFSDLNNLTDISLDLRYATLCGITEEEIHNQLGEAIAQLSEACGISKDKCYERLRENYDGYRFHHKAVGVYNPFSLLTALSRNEFGSYWFETGTPTILVEVLKHTDYSLSQLSNEEATADLLGNLDDMENSPIALLYQSGYLTIKGYDERFGTYMLGFPNREVEEGFTRYLVPYYTPLKKEQTVTFVKGFVKDVEEGEPEKFMSRLEALFANGNYQIAGDAELYFSNALYVVFQLMGFYVEVERATSDGRMDMIVKTSDYIYILEFKLDKTADEALQQINDKEYAKPFEHDVRHIYKIGVNFSTKTRRIDGWKIAE